MRKNFLLLLLLCCSLCVAQKRSLTVEDLWAMKRVGSPQISPDGKMIAYTISEYQMVANSNNTDIWVVPSNGGIARQMTTAPGYDGHPRWSPDGQKIAFLSTRAGTTQIFTISINGGESKQISHIPTGVGQFCWTSDGLNFLFVSKVYANMSLQQTAKKDAAKRLSKVKAKVIDRLLYRHWVRWTNNKYKHVFILPASGGKAKDLTPGAYDCPPISLGGAQDFTMSADGKTFYFVRNTDAMIAKSVNNDIFALHLKTGKIVRITKGRGNDNSPVCSANGRYLAFRSMRREGFEADQYDLKVLDLKTKKIRNLTANFDRHVGYPSFSKSGKYLYFAAVNHHKNSIYKVKTSGGVVEKIVDNHYNCDLQISPDGKKIFFLRQAVNLPFEIFSANTDGSEVKQLTFTNSKLLQKLEMPALENFWFVNSDGWRVQGLMVKPPHFQPTKKYPMICLIHGGPQGEWSDDFHYRWNLSLFAAPGYVIVAINPRGSKGYGQKFCDAVSGDWGGGPYRDIMEGVDAALRKYSFIDKNKLAAAGASYGGYMINWIAGHSDRFDCLVSHAGVFELVSKYGSTEELWFPEWEFRGTPYHNPRLFDKFSPARYAKNFKTPTLVTHGQLDFRVPVTQGFQMFTALQRQNVPSRLIYFPDEGHLIVKPQNSRLWWNQVHGWFKKWLK